MNRKAAWTLRIAGGAALAALVVPGILVAAPFLVGAGDAEVVLSGSMSPEILAGDLVFLDEFVYRVDKAEVGDVIAFQLRPGEVPVLHRVVDVLPGGSMTHYVTKGDANEDVDPNPVPESRILGTYMFRIPWYGHLVQFAQSRAGILALVVVPSLVLLVHESWKLVQYAREEDAVQTPARKVAEYTEVRR